MSRSIAGKGYTIETWADSYGRWHASIDFKGWGAGNTGAGEALIERGRRAARRAIRREIERRQGQPVGRLTYEVVANRLDPSWNTLATLTIAEA